MSMNNLIAPAIKFVTEKPLVAGSAAVLLGFGAFKHMGSNNTEKAAQKLFESLPADMFAKKGMSTFAKTGIAGAVTLTLATIATGVWGSIVHGRLNPGMKSLKNMFKAMFHSTPFGDEAKLAQLIDQSKVSRGSTGAASDIDKLTDKHPIMKDYNKQKTALEETRDENNKLETEALKEKNKAEQAKKTLETALKTEKNKAVNINPALDSIRELNECILILEQRNQAYRTGKKPKTTDAEKLRFKTQLKSSKTPKNSAECEAQIQELQTQRNTAITTVETADKKYKDLASLLKDVSKDITKQEITTADLKTKTGELPKQYGSWVDGRHQSELKLADDKIASCKQEYDNRANDADRAQKKLDAHIKDEEAERAKAKSRVMAKIAKENQDQSKRIKELEAKLANP